MIRARFNPPDDHLSGERKERTMQRLVVMVLLGAVTVLTGIAPAHAARGSTHQQQTNWSQHDTAVYVVSTLNLLYTKKGQPITALLTRKVAVTEYDVLADTRVSDLYFIELRRADASLAGALAYQLGWTKPEILTLALPRGTTSHADATVLQEYRSDTKQLIGSFSSTLPH
jgi:hypothetical protein